MKRRFLLALVVVGLAGGGAGSAAAQSWGPLSVEARLDAAFPRGALAERWGTGIGFGVTAAARLLPSASLYAGYGYTRFDLDFLDEVHAVDSGFSGGLRLARAVPLGEVAVEPWAAAGLLLHEVEIRGSSTAEGGDSRPGFEAAGGVAVMLPYGLRFTTRLGYRQYDGRILSTERERVSYFSAGTGIGVSF